MKRTHRTKELSEVQALKKENEELRSLVKSLRKRLKQLEKSKHIYLDKKEDEHVEQEIEQEEINKCPECYQGFIQTVDLGIRILHSCTLCDWRKTIKGKT